LWGDYTGTTGGLHRNYRGTMPEVGKAKSNMDEGARQRTKHR